MLTNNMDNPEPLSVLICLAKMLSNHSIANSTSAQQRQRDNRDGAFLAVIHPTSCGV